MRYTGNHLLSRKRPLLSGNSLLLKGWSHTPANNTGRPLNSEEDLGDSSSSATGKACPQLQQQAPLPAEPSAKALTHPNVRAGRGSKARTDSCLEYHCNIPSESTRSRNLKFPQFSAAPLLLTGLGMSAFPSIYKWPTQWDKPVAKPPSKVNCVQREC